MQNREELVADGELEDITPIQASKADDWANFRDDDIMQQQSAIQAVEAEKIPFVGDKEPLSSLAAEYQSGSPILLEKIKVLIKVYQYL
ncbi:OVARIAN TUMOR DOMAIN-containing deubiquitinating enzyme 1-like isoform X2 [Actinidia eriantha]|uniref:OVARIAN TUMOR DOMAIN-containing deubiquitinating enzyme 1-like isoform X2 n=1 Tax=Actinidia eriantha TaxID=165200 RepID=UPI0025893781|nr:OVARIAN TUMOR DOMAIN-containing deubiquitinating enzyme 1-like isoform X2 [Actinidia eriantha]